MPLTLQKRYQRHFEAPVLTMSFPDDQDGAYRTRLEQVDLRLVEHTTCRFLAPQNLEDATSETMYQKQISFIFCVQTCRRCWVRWKGQRKMMTDKRLFEEWFYSGTFTSFRGTLSMIFFYCKGYGEKFLNGFNHRPVSFRKRKKNNRLY